MWEGAISAFKGRRIGDLRKVGLWHFGLYRACSYERDACVETMDIIGWYAETNEYYATQFNQSMK